jgi:hypothetical protein
MKIHKPIPHWNNSTVLELKEILKHCRALDKLGIAQDEKMITSIERDISMREKKIIPAHNPPFELKQTKTKGRKKSSHQNKQKTTARVLT